MNIELATAARPYPGETVSGDAVSVEQHGGIYRLAVIDGLGHGPAAADAARAATAALAANPEFGPVEVLACAHRAVAGTRGAAIAVAAIDVHQQRMIYAGLGNIDAHLLQRGRVQRLSTDRGILGVTHRRLHPLSLDLERDWLLVMHSDGISARFDLSALLTEAGHEPRRLAEMLLLRWARTTDDATVAVIQPALYGAK